jgi:hypothetical protein
MVEAGSITVAESLNSNPFVLDYPLRLMFEFDFIEDLVIRLEVVVFI